MAVPKVVIVGRPNVGKSSIFNWILKRRVAIVDPASGVTRDRVDALAEHRGRFFEIVDTGGMGVTDRDGLTEDIEKQIAYALVEASVIMHVVDGREGTTALDDHVAQKVRACNKPTVFVANKCDSFAVAEAAVADFSKYGNEVICVSTAANHHREELLDVILGCLPATGDHVKSDVAMKLAVVGKRNAGKSTFINSLAQSDRMIVSEVPGTTRDSVDVRFERNQKVFIAIDTAGIRKRRSVRDSVEFYGLARAQRTIRRSDVVLFFIDGPTPISKVDKKLAEYILDQCKPCVLVVNKWDLVGNATTTSEFDDYLQRALMGFDFAPRAFITAKADKNIHALVDLAQNLFKQSRCRVSTGDLNRVFARAVAHQPPPVRRNKRPKIFYATQVACEPPTIVLFCNNPRLFDPSYRRYLLNVCRDELPFSEIPIRLHYRRRESHLPRADEEGNQFDHGTDSDRAAAADEGSTRPR